MFEIWASAGSRGASFPASFRFWCLLAMPWLTDTLLSLRFHLSWCSPLGLLAVLTRPSSEDTSPWLQGPPYSSSSDVTTAAKALFPNKITILGPHMDLNVRGHTSRAAEVGDPRDFRDYR